MAHRRGVTEEEMIVKLFNWDPIGKTIIRVTFTTQHRYLTITDLPFLLFGSAVHPWDFQLTDKNCLLQPRVRLLFPARNLRLSRPMATPRFFSQPLQYMRWASYEKPAIFYSLVIGSIGPASFLFAPPIRRFFNDGPRERIPLTYPSKLLRG